MGYDGDAATELSLYVDNEYDLYQQKKAIAKNLTTKFLKGKYDHARAPQAWSYVVDAGAKKYAREFATAGEWHKIFSAKTRAVVAQDLANRWHAGAKRGEFEDV